MCRMERAQNQGHDTRKEQMNAMLKDMLETLKELWDYAFYVVLFVLAGTAILTPIVYVGQKIEAMIRRKKGGKN